MKTWLLTLLLLLCLGAGVIHAQQEDEDDDDDVDLTVDDPLILLWDQVEAQPSDFSVGCIPVNNPANAVFYDASVPFPLASITKLMIFIEFARRVDSGLISAFESVQVTTLERYNLPRTDRGAHDRYMAIYPPNVRVVSLWELASIGMIQYSSNAASDYLLDRLAPIDWDSLYRSLGMNNSDHPHSLTMIPLLMNNHITGEIELNDLESLSVEQGEAYLDAYVEDDVWRQAEIEHRSERGSQFPDWEVQSAFLEQVTANGTVADFLRVMNVIYGDSPALTEGVKDLVRLALRWQENDFINEAYIEFGSKLGFYSGGTLTLVAYGYPVDGEPVLSAVFLRNIPRQMYNSMVWNDSVGDLAHWMNFNACNGLREAINLFTG